MITNEDLIFLRMPTPLAGNSTAGPCERDPLLAQSAAHLLRRKRFAGCFGILCFHKVLPSR